MNWRHTDFQSVALPTELPRRQPHMLPHPFSPSIEPPFSCDTNPLTQSKRMYYILSQAPTLYVGPNQGKYLRSPMSRYSLHRPRRNRAVWDRPAPASSPVLFPSPCPQESPYQAMEGPSTIRGTPSSTVTPAFAPSQSGALPPPLPPAPAGG